MITNVQALKGKIVEKSLTQDAVAESMGLDRATFYRKMKSGGAKFTVGDIGNIANILDLSNDDILRIFFSRELA